MEPAQADEAFGDMSCPGQAALSITKKIRFEKASTRSLSVVLLPSQ